MITDISEIIDLDRCPVDRSASEAGGKFARKCRFEYQQTGLCTLPEFIRPDFHTALVKESDGYIDHAYFCDSAHSVYLTDSAGRNDEPYCSREQTFVGSVPYDCIPRQSLLNRLYLWDPLKDFIGFVLAKDPFYRFADPFGACSVNVFVNGGRHGWHFDESEYTVTLMLQAPESGGDFEYVPLIRGLDDEKIIVADILNGNNAGVVKLPFTPGTLVIFGGRQTLHRVTRVEGDRPRLVSVLCYSESPDIKNSAAVRKLFWGRENPGDPLDRRQ